MKSQTVHGAFLMDGPFQVGNMGLKPPKQAAIKKSQGTGRKRNALGKNQAASITVEGQSAVKRLSTL